MIDQSKAIIFSLLADKPVAYHPDIAKMLKSVTACIFLAQLLYWSGRGHDEWIYKTQAEWYEETGLSRKEQETARRELRKYGILQEMRKGQPARLYYRLDLERLAEYLSEYYSKFKNSDPDDPNSPNMKDESEHSSMPETGNLECINRANKIAPKSHTIYTENTTENTNREYPSIHPSAKKDKSILDNKPAMVDGWMDRNPETDNDQVELSQVNKIISELCQNSGANPGQVQEAIRRANKMDKEGKVKGNYLKLVESIAKTIVREDLVKSRSPDKCKITKDIPN